MNQLDRWHAEFEEKWFSQKSYRDSEKEVALKWFIAAKESSTINELKPEDDDGAALRLAVQCGITIILDAYMHWGVITQTKFVRHDHFTCPYETHGNDPMAATRKAIVRAAEEINAAKKKSHKQLLG